MQLQSELWELVETVIREILRGGCACENVVKIIGHSAGGSVGLDSYCSDGRSQLPRMQRKRLLVCA
jgi:hypothetical protein